MCPVHGLTLGEPSMVSHNVAHPALPNQHRDQHCDLMVAHEVLPVRASMHNIKVPVVDL